MNKLQIIVIDEIEKMIKGDSRDIEYLKVLVDLLTVVSDFNLWAT